MLNSKNIKDTAVLVGAIAGIVTGIEKVRSTVLKWKADYKERKELSKKDTV